jgi:hypothetical protein
MSFEKWRAMKAAIADAIVQRPGEDYETFMQRGSETASLEILVRAIIDAIDEIIGEIEKRPVPTPKGPPTNVARYDC